MPGPGGRSRLGQCGSGPWVNQRFGLGKSRLLVQETPHLDAL